ncbi:unnamed protein product, partial [Sphacelaria rigidula]
AQYIFPTPLGASSTDCTVSCRPLCCDSYPFSPSAHRTDGTSYRAMILSAKIEERNKARTEGNECLGVLGGGVGGICRQASCLLRAVFLHRCEDSTCAAYYCVWVCLN